MPDLYKAGGIPAVQAELAKQEPARPRLFPPSPAKRWERTSAVRRFSTTRRSGSIDNPYSQTGGLQILWGNIAPDGCVVKRSAVAPGDAGPQRPRARVFDSEDAAIAAIYAGDIHPGDVVVIRYEGPKGGPGMREMLNPTCALAGMKLDTTVALITDGRFSGAVPGRGHRPRQPRRPPPAAPSVWCREGRHHRDRHSECVHPPGRQRRRACRPQGRPTSSPSRTSRPVGWHGTQGWSPAPIWARC